MLFDKESFHKTLQALVDLWAEPNPNEVYISVQEDALQHGGIDSVNAYLDDSVEDDDSAEECFGASSFSNGTHDDPDTKTEIVDKDKNPIRWTRALFQCVSYPIIESLLKKMLSAAYTLHPVFQKHETGIVLDLYIKDLDDCGDKTVMSKKEREDLKKFLTHLKTEGMSNFQRAFDDLETMMPECLHRLLKVLDPKTPDPKTPDSKAKSKPLKTSDLFDLMPFRKALSSIYVSRRKFPNSSDTEVAKQEAILIEQIKDAPESFLRYTITIGTGIGKDSKERPFGKLLHTILSVCSYNVILELICRMSNEKSWVAVFADKNQMFQTAFDVILRGETVSTDNAHECPHEKSTLLKSPTDRLTLFDIINKLNTRAKTVTQDSYVPENKNAAQEEEKRPAAAVSATTPPATSHTHTSSSSSPSPAVTSASRAPAPSPHTAQPAAPAAKPQPQPRSQDRPSSSSSSSPAVARASATAPQPQLTEQKRASAVTSQQQTFFLTLAEFYPKRFPQGRGPRLEGEGIEALEQKLIDQINGVDAAQNNPLAPEAHLFTDVHTAKIICPSRDPMIWLTAFFVSASDAMVNALFDKLLSDANLLLLLAQEHKGRRTIDVYIEKFERAGSSLVMSRALQAHVPKFMEFLKNKGLAQLQAHLSDPEQVKAYLATLRTVFHDTTLSAPKTKPKSLADAKREPVVQGTRQLDLATFKTALRRLKNLRQTDSKNTTAIEAQEAILIQEINAASVRSLVTNMHHETEFDNTDCLSNAICRLSSYKVLNVLVSKLETANKSEADSLRRRMDYKLFWQASGTKEIQNDNISAAEQLELEARLKAIEGDPTPSSQPQTPAAVPPVDPNRKLNLGIFKTALATLHALRLHTAEINALPVKQELGFREFSKERNEQKIAEQEAILVGEINAAAATSLVLCLREKNPVVGMRGDDLAMSVAVCHLCSYGTLNALITKLETPEGIASDFGPRWDTQFFWGWGNGNQNPYITPAQQDSLELRLKSLIAKSRHAEAERERELEKQKSSTEATTRQADEHLDGQPLENNFPKQTPSRLSRLWHNYWRSVIAIIFGIALVILAFTPAGPALAAALTLNAVFAPVFAWIADIGLAGIGLGFGLLFSGLLLGLPSWTLGMTLKALAVPVKILNAMNSYIIEWKKDCKDFCKNNLGNFSLGRAFIVAIPLLILFTVEKTLTAIQFTLLSIAEFASRTFRKLGAWQMRRVNSKAAPANIKVLSYSDRSALMSPDVKDSRASFFLHLHYFFSREGMKKDNAEKQKHTAGSTPPASFENDFIRTRTDWLLTDLRSRTQNPYDAVEESAPKLGG